MKGRKRGVVSESSKEIDWRVADEGETDIRSLGNLSSAHSTLSSLHVLSYALALATSMLQTAVYTTREKLSEDFVRSFSLFLNALSPGRARIECAK